LYFLVDLSTFSGPSYIPADHEPIIEGDFNEYIELWELKKASNWAGFIRWKNGSTGVQVASGVASKSGTGK
jgi:hypothetical protein